MSPLWLVLLSCGRTATAPVSSIAVNPTRRSARVKLMTRKNVLFSLWRWIQKTKTVKALARRMTTDRKMRMHKNTISLVSDIVEKNGMRQLIARDIFWLFGLQKLQNEFLWSWKFICPLQLLYFPFQPQVL